MVFCYSSLNGLRQQWTFTCDSDLSWHCSWLNKKQQTNKCSILSVHLKPYQEAGSSLLSPSLSSLGTPWLNSYSHTAFLLADLSLTYTIFCYVCIYIYNFHYSWFTLFCQFIFFNLFFIRVYLIYSFESISAAQHSDPVIIYIYIIYTYI